MASISRRAFIKTGVVAGGVVVFGVAIRRGDYSNRVRDLVAADGDELFDIWLKISPDNTITAIVPHAEMGQGAHTSLALMLADELDADWSKVRMQEAPARDEYTNYALARGYVAGSIDFPGWLLDTVDGIFLQSSKQLDSVDGLIFETTHMVGMQLTGGSTSVSTTGQVAMRAIGAATRSVLLLAAADTMQVPVDELRSGNSVISHAASGQHASYAELAPAAAQMKMPDKPELKDSSAFRLMGHSPPRLDIPAKVDGTAAFGIDTVLPDMKYAAIKASPVFGGEVLSVDEAPLVGVPGVHKVVRLHDSVAVVADGYWQAKQALELLRIEFSDPGNAREQSDIFEQFVDDLDRSAKARNEYVDYARGSTASALTQSHKRIAAEYRVPYLAHATMEPMNCTAWAHDGQCELWLGCQNPLAFASTAAKAIGLERDDVTVHNQYLGGGFGRRVFPDYAVQAAQIAAQLAYPVKLIWSREEDTQHDHYRQACISRFEGGLRHDGMPIAWHNHFVNKHNPKKATHIPYDIKNQRIVHTLSRTDVPWGFWRSVDHSLHAFFTESFIDELAVTAGRDGYEYRRQLLAKAPRFRAVLDLAAEKAGWGQPLPENFGRGIAVHQSFETLVAQVAEVEIQNGKPRVRRVVCAVDPGFAVHPDGLTAQMESGIVYGLTAAMYGEISIKQGAVEQSNFHDYQMLRMNEAPAIDTHIINSGEPMGGAGEPATPPIAPAVCNAIYAATGVRIRELPIYKHSLGDRHA